MDGVVIERLFTVSNAAWTLVADALRVKLRALIAAGCFVEHETELATHLYSSLKDVLEAARPIQEFRLRKGDIEAEIRNFLGEKFCLDEELVNLLIEVKHISPLILSQVQEFVPMPVPLPPPVKPLEEPKVVLPSRSKAKDDTPFKNLYMQAYDRTPELLAAPEMAISLLEILTSVKSNDDIQEELLGILGYDNVDIAMEMIKTRAQTKKTFSKLERQTRVADSGFYQHSSQITVKRESDLKLERELRKSGKRQQGPITNMDVLVKMGFDAAFTSLGKLEEASTVSSQVSYDAPIFQRKALPANMKTTKSKFYIEHTVPAPPNKLVSEDRLIPITAFEEWCRPAFSGIKHLNAMQSLVFESAYFSTNNVLVCAPTGAGKTNIALMCVMRTLKSCMDENNVLTGVFKIIYVAPMKALASEITDKFSAKLKYLGINVRELTGDMQLSRAEITKTHIIVTTPEKWDVVTRKTESIAPLVKLLILDEIHLLDDERGAVLESIVARTLRQVERSQSTIRIIGLSATLPNHVDVARFLNVPEGHYYKFDGEYRPVPLEMRFIGVKDVASSEESMHLMLEACYDKVLEQVRNDKQVLVFVHSRKDTIKTAQNLIDLARARDSLRDFECCSSPQSIKDVGKSKNRDLCALFDYGFGIHNAGMLRKDRNLSEKLFKDGNIKVLVTTATLAWGVNLPAHAVIIKGTQIYDSSAGSFKDLGVLDVQQIFGRAGRPDYDTSGLGVIITTQNKLAFYLDMLITQRSIESRFLTNLEDELNAEVALGTVSSLAEGILWLRYTYFYVRGKRNPLAYGFPMDVMESEGKYLKAIETRLTESSTKLHEWKMVRFDPRNGTISSTFLGRTASHYYIKSESVAIYNQMLLPEMTDDDVFKMFSESHEFEQLKMRADEEMELESIRQAATLDYAKLTQEDMSRTFGKVVTLLLGYLHKVPVDTFSLVADMAYVVQNGSRIIRALFEIALRNYWSQLAIRFLDIARQIDRRVGMRSSPLRQFTIDCNMGGFTASTSQSVFKGGFLDADIVNRVESCGLTIEKVRDTEPKELAFLLNHDKFAREAEKFVRFLPALEMTIQIFPITGSIAKFHIELTPMFTWSDRWHGKAQSYWVWVDDGERIIHHEHYILHQEALRNEEKPSLTFAVFVDKQADYYWVRILSEYWYGADTEEQIDISEVDLPQEQTQHTELLDLNPLPIAALQNPQFEALYRFPYFNPIQTQIFHSLYHHDLNVLVGAPTGSGKTIAAEIAIFRVFTQTPDKKIVYIAPLKALARERLKDWTPRFGLLGKSVVELTGDYTPDIGVLNTADVVITTPEKWDGISRNWQHRSYVQAVALVVIDEIHLLGQDRGAVLEVIVSRMRYIAVQLKTSCRIIGLSTALANSLDLGNWLGISSLGFFNFRPTVRPVPIQLHIDGFSEKAYCPRMASMNKPAYNAIQTFSPNKPVLIFVSSRRQTRLTANDLILFSMADRGDTGFLRIPGEEMDMIVSRIRDNNLKQALHFGVGLHHAGLCDSDRNIVEELFVNGKIYILVATGTLAWGVNFPAHLVIIKGTEHFDVKEKKYVEQPITDIMQMIGRAGRPQYDDNGIACVYVQEDKKSFWKTFIHQPFPVESSLKDKLYDHFNAEIGAGTLTSRATCIDYLTWTYFFRRLTRNPTYYHLYDNTVEGVNNYLVGLVNHVLSTLEANECVEVDESGLLTATSLGTIASFYYLQYRTVKKLKDKLKGQELSFAALIELLSSVYEFEDLPVRHNEELLNEELAHIVPYKVNLQALDSPHVKTHLLLQAHFSRLPLPIADYLTDTKSVLDQAIRVVYGMVDIAAQEGGHLQTVLKMMTIGQMLVQGQWYHNSSLKNLPGMSDQNISRLFHAEENIEVLAQLVEMDFKTLGKLIGSLGLEMGSQDRDDLFTSLRKLPLMEVSYEVKQVEDRPVETKPEEEEEDLWGEKEDPRVLRAGELRTVEVTLTRINKGVARRPLFNHIGKNNEMGLWLMVGCVRNNEVLALRKFQLPKRQVTHSSLTIQLPENADLRLYLVCDSYLGLDQEYRIGTVAS